jgi:hypothetical protein
MCINQFIKHHGFGSGESASDMSYGNNILLLLCLSCASQIFPCFGLDASPTPCVLCFYSTAANQGQMDHANLSSCSPTGTTGLTTPVHHKAWKILPWKIQSGENIVLSLDHHSMKATTMSSHPKAYLLFSTTTSSTAAP